MSVNSRGFRDVLELIGQEGAQQIAIDRAGRDIRGPFTFTGSKAASNGLVDRFVVSLENTLVVVTQNGDVFGHEVSGRNVGAPFKFTGSKAAFNGPADRFVVTIGTR
jgi:hypothetical protein